MNRRNFIKKSGLTLGSATLFQGLVSSQGYASETTYADCNCTFEVYTGAIYTLSPAMIADAINEIGAGTAILGAIKDKILLGVKDLTGPVTSTVYDASPQWVKEFWGYVGEGYEEFVGQTAPVREKIADYAAAKWNEIKASLASACAALDVSKNTTVKVECINGVFQEIEDTDLAAPGSILDTEITAGPITASIKVEIESSATVTGSCAPTATNGCTATVKVEQKIKLEISVGIEALGSNLKATGDSEKLLPTLTLTRGCGVPQ